MRTQALDLYGLRKSFIDGEVLICFNGPFSHSVIEEIGIAVKRYLETETTSRSAVSDVFAVFVELAQNVQAYTGRLKDRKDEAGLRRGTLAIGRQGNAYAVTREHDGPGPRRRPGAAPRRAARHGQGGAQGPVQGEASRSAPSRGRHGLGLIDVARRATRLFLELPGNRRQGTGS